jgi:hypothetical protein
MRSCQEFVNATKRCGKQAVISELTLGIQKDLCAECAKRIYLRARSKKPVALWWDRPPDSGPED